MSGLVYVSSMARAGALPEAGIGIRTSCPQKILERIPRRRQAEAVRALLLETLKAKKQSEHVYVDADLVREPPRGPAGVADFVARLKSPPSSLVPAGNGSGLYEVVLP